MPATRQNRNEVGNISSPTEEYRPPNAGSLPTLNACPRTQPSSIMQRILFVFLDGVGLGPDGPENPFAARSRDAFYQLAGGQRWTQPFGESTSLLRTVRSLDATLGFEGLPQSGTGQATLMTGINCAKLVGRHFGPFPHSNTHEVLDRANLFHEVKTLRPQDDTPAAFANAFPPQYFKATRRRTTVTTRCCNAAQIEIRTIAALREGRALSADLTGAAWRKQLFLDVPLRDPTDAAQVLASTAQQHSFTLFEYFLTDKVGHRRIETPASELLADLNQFLAALMEALDPARDTLLITSDHGNLEDTSHTQHTRNPVPLIVSGWAAPHFARTSDLTDVMPAILKALRSAPRS